MAREIEIKVRVSDSTKFVEFLNTETTFIGEQHQVDEYFTPPDRDFTATKPVNEWLRLRIVSEPPAGISSGVGSPVLSLVEGDSPEVEEAGLHRSSINYKLWHRDPADGRSLYADEFETPIESIVALREIFTALKFRSLCVVDKVRKTWRYDARPDEAFEQSGVILDPKSPSGDYRDQGSRKTWIPDPVSPEANRSGMISQGKTETYEIALDTEKILGDFVEVELIGETTDDVATVRDRMLRFLHDHGITDPDADQVGYPYLLLFGDPSS